MQSFHLDFMMQVYILHNLIFSCLPPKTVAVLEIICFAIIHCVFELTFSNDIMVH